MKTEDLRAEDEEVKVDSDGGEVGRCQKEATITLPAGRYRHVWYGR